MSYNVLEVEGTGLQKAVDSSGVVVTWDGGFQIYSRAEKIHE